MSDVQVMAAIVAAMVVLFVWNRLPVVVVAAAAGLSLWAAGLLTLPEALAGYGDPAVVFIATLFVISAALERTGVTAWAGQALIAGAGEESRARLLVLTGLLVALLTALISNTATALILIPIGIAAAEALGVSALPLLMGIAIAAAAAFLTPIATPTNLMVMGPGGYAFGDYWKLGLPLMLWFFAVTVVVVPLVWPF